jgi:hypothetical protein
MRTEKTVAWGRSLVAFIVAWLVAVYVYDVVREHNKPVVGFALAALTFAVNGFARWRAAKSAGQVNWKFHFWVALPFILFFMVPIVIKIVAYLQSGAETPWYQYLWALMPFLLKLGVPVLALLWIYILFGRLDRERQAAAA